MAHAVTLQQLISALSFKYMAQDNFIHRHIPDTPQIESERRQIFFARALDLPTFYVRRNTRNRLLLKIMRHAHNMRNSRRYPGYIRIYVKDYCIALLEMIQNDAQDLIEELDCAPMLEDLWQRIEFPEEHAVSGRLTQSIVSRCGRTKGMDIPAHEFNAAAEEYYRTDLRRTHMQEGIELLTPDIRTLYAETQESELKHWLAQITQGREPGQCFEHYGKKLGAQRLERQSLLNMINMVLSSIYTDGRVHNEGEQKGAQHVGSASVYRAC